MKWESATKEQLLHIALSEDCELNSKYEAVMELENRKIKPDPLPVILCMFGQGYGAREIAKAANVSLQQIEKIVERYELWKVMLRRDKREFIKAI